MRRTMARLDGVIAEGRRANAATFERMLEMQQRLKSAQDKLKNKDDAGALEGDAEPG